MDLLMAYVVRGLIAVILVVGGLATWGIIGSWGLGAIAQAIGLVTYVLGARMMWYVTSPDASAGDTFGATLLTALAFAAFIVVAYG